MKNDFSMAKRRAFSLIELLVTMAIAASLLTLAARSLNQGSAGLQLQGAADSVVAILAQTRQMAATTNAAHDLRVYQWQEGPDRRIGFFIHRVLESGEVHYTGERHLCDASTQLWPTLSSFFTEPTHQNKEDPPIGGGPFPASGYTTIRIQPSGRTDFLNGPVDAECAYLSLTTMSELLRKRGPRHFVTVRIHRSNGATQLLSPGI